ncbi:glycosyltransferase [Crocinitomix sp.]|nr:glycosyltransferase [Crocinitomix sp.]
MAKFSILIAHYNNGKYFAECWQSILSQTFLDWEVIIVDDCSSDNSVKLIQDLIAGDKRCKFFQNELNKGCGFTKRKCAELASGDIFGFVDPDDSLSSNALEVMINTCESNPTVDFVFSRFSIVDENHNLISNKKSQGKVHFNDPYFFNFGGVISHFAAFRKEIYVQTEGIDPYMLRAVDQDLYLKLCETGVVMAIDHLLYNYRIHEKGISTGGANNQNVSKATYWHWYAINAAAKRRGIYVEDLFTKSFLTTYQFNRLTQKIELIEKSGSYKLAQKLSQFARIFKKRQQRT